jgi:hypothetical protein
MIIQTVSRGFAIAILVLTCALIYKYLKNDSTKKKELPEKGNTEKNDNLKGNPTSDLNDIVHEFSFLQYKARMQQWTGIAQTEWQIETISVAVTAGILAAAFGYIHEPLVSGFVLVFGAAMDFSLAAAISKNHLIGRMLQEYIRKIERENGLHQLPMEANEIARFLMDNDEEYEGKPVNKFLGFFQRRDLAFLLVASTLAFAVILLGFGIVIMLTWWIP